MFDDSKQDLEDLLVSDKEKRIVLDTFLEATTHVASDISVRLPICFNYIFWEDDGDNENDSDLLCISPRTLSNDA